MTTTSLLSLVLGIYLFAEMLGRLIGACISYFWDTRLYPKELASWVRVPLFVGMLVFIDGGTVIAAYVIGLIALSCVDLCSVVLRAIRWYLASREKSAPAGMINEFS